MSGRDRRHRLWSVPGSLRVLPALCTLWVSPATTIRLEPGFIRPSDPKTTPGLWAVSRHFVQFVASSHVLESTCPDFHHFYCAALQPIDFLITVMPEVRRDICSWIIFLGDQAWELAQLPNSHPDFSLRSEVHVAAGLHTPSFDLILPLPNLLQLTKPFSAWGWRFFQPVRCVKAGCCIHR